MPDYHVFLRKGALLDEVHDHDFYEDAWRLADASTFNAVRPV